MGALVAGKNDMPDDEPFSLTYHLNRRQLRLTEDWLRKEPANLQLRESLLKHYYHCDEAGAPAPWKQLRQKMGLVLVKASKGYFTLPGTREHRVHVAWFVMNDPSAEAAGLPEMRMYPERDPIGANIIKGLWREAVTRHSNRTEVLSNAVKSLMYVDRDLSEQWLKQCVETEPGNLEWPCLLAELQMRFSKTQRLSLIYQVALLRWKVQQARNAEQNELAVWAEQKLVGLELRLSNLEDG